MNKGQVSPGPFIGWIMTMMIIGMVFMGAKSLMQSSIDTTTNKTERFGDYHKTQAAALRFTSPAEGMHVEELESGLEPRDVGCAVSEPGFENYRFWFNDTSCTSFSGIGRYSRSKHYFLRADKPAGYPRISYMWVWQR